MTDLHQPPRRDAQKKRATIRGWMNAVVRRFLADKTDAERGGYDLILLCPQLMPINEVSSLSQVYHETG